MGNKIKKRGVPIEVKVNTNPHTHNKDIIENTTNKLDCESIEVLNKIVFEKKVEKDLTSIDNKTILNKNKRKKKTKVKSTTVKDITDVKKNIDSK